MNRVLERLGVYGSVLVSALVLAPTAGAAFASTGEAVLPADPDSDGDGLSDFHERHKHFTDPHRADSDGDGTPDGDWDERREHTYTVRTIIQVVPPVTPDVLCDDYQDARILDQTDEYVELEVIHYPLNTVAQALKEARPASSAAAQASARGASADHADAAVSDALAPWRRPGPTANWDAEMRAELLAALRDAGIDAATLGDRELVEQASKWLLRHARYVDGFSTFSTEFVDGSARVHPELVDTVRRNEAQTGLSLEEQWERELFAKGMFRNGMRGSCTSSAIYLNGCLRALGIPARIVLVTPLVDASDPRELELLSRLRHHGVRKAVQTAIPGPSDAWSSHTFNEVFVDGRWRRLNYDRLGQNTLDPDFLGLMTHVATFSDWADGRMASTWGLRQARHDEGHEDALGGSNPYSTITLSDRFGVHASIENPPVGGDEDSTVAAAEGEREERAVAEAPAVLTIAEASWSDRPDSPATLPPGFGPALLMRVGPSADFDAHKRFTQLADRRFFLESPGQPRLALDCGVGGFTTDADTYLAIQLSPADLNVLREGVAYTLRPRNASGEHRWQVAEGLTIVR